LILIRILLILLLKLLKLVFLVLKVLVHTWIKLLLESVTILVVLSILKIR
jgi:hypothetical protein